MSKSYVSPIVEHLAEAWATIVDKLVADALAVQRSKYLEAIEGLQILRYSGVHNGIKVEYPMISLAQLLEVIGTVKND